MNCQRVYDALIAAAVSRGKTNCYSERHHIIPKALGGSNQASNLVALTAREHCLAHLLLAKIHGGKMWHAAHLMKNRFTLTSRAYASAREKHKILSTGDKHAQFGKTGKHSHNFKYGVQATNIKTGAVTFLYGEKEQKAAGFNQGHISECANGKRKTHKGHTFLRIE